VAAKGKVIPAKWLRLFAELRGYDPVASAAPGDTFDADAAEKACRFFPACIKHVKGRSAGQPFELADWEKAIVGCLFGWKRSNGRLRYVECLIYVAKKNGKSTFATAILLMILALREQQGMELYSIAASRDQAAIIFGHAVGMIRQEPGFKKLLRPYGDRGGSQQRSIVRDENMSSYKPLSSDVNTADGLHPDMIVADEIHRHKSSELVDTLNKSTADSPEPLTIYTTTADFNRVSFCNDLLKRAKLIRDNGGDPAKAGHDPGFLPFICECDKADDWMDPAVWAKANPNLGVTVPEEFLARECQKAQDSPSELNNFLRLHMNIVTDADVAWLPMDKWDACATTTDVLDGQQCFAGLDLSSTRDVTALSLVFPRDDGSWTVDLHCWIPADNAREREKRDRVPYTTWARQAEIELTEGDVVDYDVIRKRINELNTRYSIREIAIDRWNSTQIQTQLIGDGFTVTPFGQGYASMSAPAKEFEKSVIAGTLDHRNSPVLRWMAGNVMIETDAAGNIKPSKKTSTEKIDGVVATVMALGCAMVSEGDGVSLLETRGLVGV
jgi:phage terminase large subunit-like protein